MKLSNLYSNKSCRLNRLRNIFSQWIMLSIICVGFSLCSSTSENPVLDIEAPKLLEVDPIAGSEDLSVGPLTITLTFDQKIVLDPKALDLIQIDNATVNEVSVNITKMMVKLSNLAYDTHYELLIPEGVVKGLSGKEVTSISIQFSTVGAPTKPEVSLCTPHPLPQAQKVYDYLHQIYGQKILSASMANVNWNIAEAELVKQATGKYPAIATFDYIHLFASPADWIDYGDITVVKNWWKEGGLVAAGWHWNVPNVENGSSFTCTPGDGKQNQEGNWTTTFRPSHIFVEGSWERKVVDADLDEMVGYLKLLQDEGIPVIWRPLHEAAGNIYVYPGGKAWFWWGYDGAEAYKKLWRYMFDYFAERGIRNLIWVWTAQTKDEDFYPGDEYVDMVGCDIYNKTAEEITRQYQLVAQNYPNKLLVLSECGGVANISEQWESGARWGYFMPWYHYNATTLIGHQHADIEWWKDAMNHDFILSRDQLPSMK